MQVQVLLSAPKQRERFSLSFCFGASLGISTRRLADVGHIPLAESCRGTPVYGKRQRPVVRICFSTGSRIVACGKTQGKNNATKFLKNLLTEYGFRVKIHIIIIER